MLNKTTNELQVFDDFEIDRSLPKHKSEKKFSSNIATFTVDSGGNLTGGESTRFMSDDGDSVNPPRDFNIAGIIEGDPHYWDGISYEIKSEIQRQQLINNLELQEEYRRGGVRFAPLTKLYLWAFSKKYKNKPTRSIESFFVSVKHTKEQLEKIDDRIENYKTLVTNAIAGGQKALEEKLLREIEIIGYESQLYGLGYTKVVTEEQLVKFVKMTERGLRLDWIKNFTRVLPDDVLKKKKELDAHKIFDNWLILHYDKENKHNDKTEKEKKIEKEKKKDPILFGVIKGSRKLYFIAEWIDEICDLQFKDIAKQLGVAEMKKSEITNKIKV